MTNEEVSVKVGIKRQSLNTTGEGDGVSLDTS